MNERLHELFARHLQHQLNAEERTELMGLLLEPTLQDNVQQMVHAVWEISGEEEGMSLEKSWLLLNELFTVSESEQVIPMRTKGRKRWIAAASILLLILAGAYAVFFHKKDKPELAIISPAIKEVPAPKTSKATITLASGATLLLDSLKSLNEGGIAIAKDKNGHVVYEGAAKEQQYNILVNPRGSKVVTIQLADGTRVWLNAASSLKYFTSNTGATREVEITGEGYFEVAKQAARPFIVRKGTTSITVLGTHFNIYSYDDEDEQVQVTLLEGSVKVTSRKLQDARRKPDQAVTLKPGEQVSVTYYQLQHPVLVNTDAVIAWKNGWFSFSNTGLPAIMRQLARWYDIEVEYEGNISTKVFSGDIDRSLTLNQVLKGLARTGIRYKFINDKKILIHP